MLRQVVANLFRPAVRHRWALVVVAVLQVYLFCGFHYDRWYKSLLPLGRPRARTGEGLVVRCDGLGYYAWLRSLLIDGDWVFDNEFDDFNVVGDYVPPASKRTPTERRANPWSVGPACVWAVSVMPGHYAVKSLRRFGLRWPADGYSLPYQLLIGITSVFFSILGLGFLYGMCREFADPKPAALAAALVTLSTTIIYYGAIEVSMAHGIATAVVAAFLWFWTKTCGSDSPWRWLLLGLLLGITALMRWQLATLAILPVGEAASNVLVATGPTSARVVKQFAKVAICFVAAAVAFSPQLIAWRTVYGDWWPSPITVSQNWLQPAFWQVLFSQNRSLFYWTPFTAIGVLSYLALFLQSEGEDQPNRCVDALNHCCRRGRMKVSGLLMLAGFGLQVYVLSSIWGMGVYLGVAYGFRHLTESVLLLGPGVAMLLQRMPRHLYIWFAAAGCALALWNLIVVAEYRYGLVPWDCGAGPSALAANAIRLIVRKRILLLGQVAFAPLLLWLFVGRQPARRGTSRPITPANRLVMRPSADRRLTG